MNYYLMKVKQILRNLIVNNFQKLKENFEYLAQRVLI